MKTDFALVFVSMALLIAETFVGFLLLTVLIR